MWTHTRISETGQLSTSLFHAPCILFPQVHKLLHVPNLDTVQHCNTHKTIFSESSWGFEELSLSSSDGFLGETTDFGSVVVFSRKLLCPVPHFRVDLSSVDGLGASEDIGYTLPICEVEYNYSKKTSFSLIDFSWNPWFECLGSPFQWFHFFTFWIILLFICVYLILLYYSKSLLISLLCLLSSFLPYHASDSPFPCIRKMIWNWERINNCTNLYFFGQSFKNGWTAHPFFWMQWIYLPAYKRWIGRVIKYSWWRVL